MVLGADQVSTFSENGFVLLDDAFDPSDTAAFERTLRRTVRSQIGKAKSCHAGFPAVPAGRELDLGIMALEEADHRYVADISDFTDMTPDLMRLSSMPLLHRAAMQLLGEDTDAPCYVTNCGLVLAMPFDRNYSYGWHKDTFYTLPDSRYIQMWAPLVEASTVELGTLEVCVGSHVAGPSEQHAVDGLPNRHRYRCDPEALDKYSKKAVEMTVGQVLLFSAGLAHRSGTNRSDRARFSVVSVYHQVENAAIRPLRRDFHFQGKTMEEFFEEKCGVVRPAGGDDTHFSPAD